MQASQTAMAEAAQAVKAPTPEPQETPAPKEEAKSFTKEDFANVPEHLRLIIERVLDSNDANKERTAVLEQHYQQSQRARLEAAKRDLKGTTLEKDKAFLAALEEHALSIDLQSSFEKDLKDIDVAKQLQAKDAELLALKERLEQQEQAFRSAPGNDPLFIRASAAAAAADRTRAAKHPWGSFNDFAQRESKRARNDAFYSGAGAVEDRLDQTARPQFGHPSEAPMTLLYNRMCSIIQNDPKGHDRDTQYVTAADEKHHLRAIEGARNRNLPRQK